MFWRCQFGPRGSLAVCREGAIARSTAASSLDGGPSARGLVAEPSRKTPIAGGRLAGRGPGRSRGLPDASDAGQTVRMAPARRVSYGSRPWAGGMGRWWRGPAGGTAVSWCQPRAGPGHGVLTACEPWGTDSDGATLTVGANGVLTTRGY